MFREDYFTMPFYKKWWINLKSAFIKKLHDFKFNWKALIVFLCFIGFIAGFVAIVINSKKPFPLRPEYNKEGFVDYTEVGSKYKKVLENDNFKFTLNSNTTFELLNKTNNQVYKSNQDGVSFKGNKDLFNLYYLQTLSTGSANVVEHSIENQTYAFRESDDSVEVLYKIDKRKTVMINDSVYSYDDMPQFIGVDRYNSIVENIQNNEELKDSDKRNYIERRLPNYYEAVEEEVDGKKIVKHYKRVEITSQTVFKYMIEIFYVYGGYNKEKLIEDNEQFNIETVLDYPAFEFSVKYTLTDNGFDFELINESIKESEKFPLVYIEVLPYFTAATQNDNGYFMIPDGSGALINFNNGKYNETYKNRIYGKRDYALTTNTSYKIEDEMQIHLPVYGMSKNNYSMISIIEDGEEMTEIVSGFMEKNPYTYTVYKLREHETYKMSNLANQSDINIWANDYNDENLKICYKFIDKEEASYVDMANSYREHLISKGDLSVGNDTTDELVMNLTLLGTYLKKEYFLGIPHNKEYSLTDTEEALLVIDSFLEKGITNINLIYDGFANAGLDPYYMENIKFEKTTGSKKDFKILKNELDNRNIDLYFDLYALTSYSDKNLNVKNNSIYNLFKKVVKRYNFFISNFTPDTSKGEIYTLSSKTLNSYLSGINKDLYDEGFTNVSYIDLGKELHSSFKKNEVQYRNTYKDEVVSYLNNENNKFNQVFRNPNSYVFKNSKYLLDLPNISTNLPIFDTTVPFLQLVLNGCIDYSGSSINLSEEHSLEWHTLKAIETGSNISFTLSYEDTVNLVDTNYTRYYSTHYINWIDKINDVYTKLNGLGIYKNTVINHESLNLDGSRVRVTYSNNVEFTIDYNTLTYSMTNLGGGN